MPSGKRSGSSRLQSAHGLGRQGGLAHAARPAHGHHPARMQPLVQPSKLLLAMEKAGFRGQGDDGEWEERKVTG